MDLKISVANARNNLPKLLKAVENGVEVTICRREVAVAAIVRLTDPPRKVSKLGTMRDKIVIHDPIGEPRERRGVRGVRRGSASSWWSSSTP